MKKRLLIALLTAVSLSTNVSAMNGIAFSASKGKGERTGPWDQSDCAGPIVKYTIASNVVTRCDTIYKQFWAKYPIVNVQGTHVAFQRLSLRGGADTITTNNKHRYLSVMDINGNNVRDLDTLAEDNSGTGKWILICWPAGDYIYYHYNVKWDYDDADGIPISEIRKVKYNDPATRQKIFTYKIIKTFSMSLDATRASMTSARDCAGKSSPFCNIPHAFPPSSDPDAGSWAGGLVLGCGSYLSPSGKHHWHFWEGGHTDNRIETITFPSQVNSTVSTDFNTIAGWITTATGLNKDSITGGNMEWGRWAANSDKWLCGVGNNKIGAKNQILWNWIDHQAINTSRNSKAINGFVPSSECGALWVAGGPCGSYEDVNGNWVATSVAGGCNNVETAPSLARTKHYGLSLSHNVNVYSALGTYLGAMDRAGISDALPKGTYFLKPASGARNEIAKIHISGNEARR